MLSLSPIKYQNKIQGEQEVEAHTSREATGSTKILAAHLEKQVV